MKSKTSASATALAKYKFRDRLAFDGGYRYIKWISPTGKVRCIPSVVKKLEAWESSQWDDQSVLVELEGARYIVGQTAKEFGGNAILEQDNKCDWAKLLAMVAMEPLGPGETELTIKTVAAALPNSLTEKYRNGVQQIQGTHQVTRNGQEMILTVEAVEAVDETRGAYHYAVKHKLFRYNQPNCILDLGGKTGICRYYGTNGSLNRGADVIVDGTFVLAQMMEAALTPQLGYSPNLGLIMDAIEQKTYTYGTTGISFEAMFEPARKKWLKGILEKLTIKLGRLMDGLGEVLIIGGSADLARSLTQAEGFKERFAIPPSPPGPQFINLIGMGAE